MTTFTVTNEELILAVRQALTDQDSCYPPEHRAFIDALIQREQRRMELWQSVKGQVFGWGIIALVGAIGTFVAKKLGIG